MIGEAVQLLVVAGAWTIYFVIHSLLASLPVKGFVAQRFPEWMPAYRIAFNLVSLVLLGGPLWLVLRYPGPTLWHWEGIAAWIANGAAVAAIAGFLWSLRYYDGREFLGLRQLNENVGSIEDQEHLHISPLHRYIRHPWYFFGLVIIWSRDMTAAWLLTCILATLYFALGSRLEERKLVTYHGRVYERYRRHVPALIPRPWRYLKPADARDLDSDARSTRRHR